MKTALVAIAALALSFVAMPAVGDAQECTRHHACRPVVVQWPSPQYLTLQSAIDAAPDGATVDIALGVYAIDEPIYVRGKSLVLKGAGSGRTGDEQITQLVGPSPRPVVDEQGNLLLLAAAVKGLFNFVGAGSTVQNMRISGFDAGIVVKDDANGLSSPMVVNDLVIIDTGRGILGLASSDLTVKDTTILRPAWNGISVAPPSPTNANVNAVQLIDPQGAGLYYANTTAIVDDVAIVGAAHGGIVGYQSALVVLDSVLHNNWEAGILLFESKAIPFLQNNTDEGTQVLCPPDKPNCSGSEGSLGDGISVWLTEANVWGNFINQSARVGVSVFGGTAHFFANGIFCSHFDLFGAEYNGVPFTLDDQGDNVCGCGGVYEICAAKGEGSQPPPPVGGLE